MLEMTIQIMQRLSSKNTKATKRLAEEVELLHESPFLDPVWYRQTYPDLRTTPIDVARHYLEHGASEGRNPSPFFDTKFYLDQNLDVAAASVNPLVHYLEHGASEGRNPSPFFDTKFYLDQNPDVVAASVNPFVHYLEHGASEGRNPSPLFDTKFYLDQNPDVAAASVNPLVHYIKYGQKEGRRPRRVEFDAEFYSTLYPDVRRSDMSPLEHFQKVGRRQGLHPVFDEEWYRAEYSDIAGFQGSIRSHFLSIGQYQGRHPAFDHEWYVREYPDVVASGIDPLDHYRRYGRSEGRHAAFDRNFYLTEYSDIANSTVNPYEHYDLAGRAEGRYPAFNRAWYMLAYKDIGRSNLDPYEHYTNAGRAEGRPLSPVASLHITPWGHWNFCSQVNTPARVDGSVPPVDEAFSPRVTVIVPNYNHARFLPERLNSIYCQTYGNFEVILLDDASSDESVSVLKEYAILHSDRTICHFNETNSGGVFYQWKRGLEIASGDLIWIAESDDFCSPDFLSELVRFFRNNAVMLAFSRTDFVMGSPLSRIWTSEAYWSEVGFDPGAEPVIMPANEVVRCVWCARNIAPNVSGVLFRNPGKLAILDDPEWLRLRMCGDWVFYLSIIRGGLVGYSPAVTNFYRQHPQNTSIGTHDKDLYYEEHEITARYLARLYQLEEGDLRRHEEVLYRHWCMKRGPDSRAQFEKLFDIDKVQRERQKRKPNIAVAIYALVPGGGETFPILIANLLLKRGFGVTVLNFEREKTNAGIRSTLDKAIPIIEPENSAEFRRASGQSRS